MALRRFLAALSLASLLIMSDAKKCYRCGYMAEGEDGPMQPLPGMPECKDQATLEDHSVDCQGGDDCCGSIVEFLELVDTETNEKRILRVGRHDCEQDLANYANYGVLCSEHTDDCVSIDRDGLPEGHNETIFRAEVCFCSGDLCNSNLPFLSSSVEPTNKPTNEPTNPPEGKKCYNCGYRRMPNGQQEALTDVAECSDEANLEDVTTICGNGDDCCASLKEYYTTVDEDTGENSTVIIGRHGCESDLNHIGEQTVLCSEHTDDCLNIDRASLPDHQDNNVTVTDIEICFCSGDRCNKWDPIPPVPTTSQPPNNAPLFLSSLTLLLSALLL